MNTINSAIYGIIQGVSEFLPVSSSGHLALLPNILHIQDPGVAFDLAMHVGTAISIIVYFNKEILHLIKSFFELMLGRSKDPFTINFILATISTVILALILKGFAESFGRNSFFIAFNLIVFGLFLWLSDFCKTDETKDPTKVLNIKDSLLIGIAQCLALFPGVSRSGITITTARILNIEKEKASRFSFLLSLPLIFGGAILKSIEVSKSPAINFSLMDLTIGIVVSFIAGVVTIHFFLKLIKRISFAYFFIYRLIIGALIIYFLKI